MPTIQTTRSRLTQRHSSARRVRGGFTLVELLLVVAIIAVLSSMLVGVMSGARNDANIAATKARMLMIEKILQEQLEEYEVRRLPISIGILQAFVTANPNNTLQDTTYVQAKNLRRRIIAELINAEMPRAFLDGNNDFVPHPDLGAFPSALATGDAPAPYDQGFASYLNAAYPNPVMIGGTSVHLVDLIALPSLRPASIDYWFGFNPSVNAASELNLPGEYLYQILARVDYRGVSALDALGNRAVADADGDGLLEVIDAWGNSLEMRLFQVDINDTHPSYASGLHLQDIFEDMPADWTDRNANRIDRNGNQNFFRFPNGFSLLNSSIPRSIDKIRVEIVSPNMRDLQ